MLLPSARSCFGLNMLTTLPLEAFVCREVMTHYYFPDAPWQARRHVLFSTGLVVAATALSLLTCDLGAVFELIGATSACALAYILPPLCYLKLSSSTRSWTSWKTLGAVVCVCFGVAVMLISIVQAVVKIVKSKFCPVLCHLSLSLSLSLSSLFILISSYPFFHLLCTFTFPHPFFPHYRLSISSPLPPHCLPTFFALRPSPPSPSFSFRL